MVNTFNISNLDYLIQRNSQFEIGKVYNIAKIQGLENYTLWQKIYFAISWKNQQLHKNEYLATEKACETMAGIEYGVTQPCTEELFRKALNFIKNGS